MHASIEEGKTLQATVTEIVQHAAAPQEDCDGEHCFGDALAKALNTIGIAFERGVWVPERQGGMALNCGQIMDFVLENSLALVISQSFGNEHEAEARLIHGMRLLGLHEGLFVAVDSTGAVEVRHVEYR